MKKALGGDADTARWL